MERFWTSYISVSNGNIKYPVGNSIFAANLPLKLFRAAVANTDIEILKSLHTLFDTYLDHMLAKFKPSRIVWNVQNFSFLTKKKKKKEFLKTIYDKSVDAILKDVPVAETSV